MYQILIKDLFCCNGKSFDQLIGVEGSLPDATARLIELNKQDFRLKNYWVEIKEVIV
jgi:hypothetical protein